MPAGLNLQGQIIRYSYPKDDSVGGAVPSGTVVYPNVWARISPMKPTQALLEQGLEMPTIFTAALSPGDLDLEQNDQFQVTSPPISNHYLHIFRIIGIQYSTMHDPRSYVIVTIRHIEKSHINELQ